MSRLQIPSNQLRAQSPCALVLASSAILLAPVTGLSAQDTSARQLADRVRTGVHRAAITGNEAALADVLLLARRAVTALPDDGLLNHYLGYALYRLGMQALEDDMDLATEALEDSEAYLQRSIEMLPIPNRTRSWRPCSGCGSSTTRRP